LTLFAVVAAVLLAALATDLLGLDGLIKATSAAFVAVYVTSTAAGVRLLSGTGRRLAAVSFAAVLVVFAFFGVYVLVPAVVAVVALRVRRPRAVAVAPAA
jgi:amino acid efflux transporter